MDDIQTYSDKIAISLSLLCALHCLALPVVIVMLPSLAALPLANEAFHVWMVLAVIPISVYALTIGCKKHQRYRVIALGMIGLLFLAFAAFLSEVYLNELWEKILTLIGASIIAFGHYWNYQLCQKQNECCC